MPRPKKGTEGHEPAVDKWRQTMDRKYGDYSEFMRKIGSKGGKVRSPLKGFGGNHELAREAGSKGGRLSRRGLVPGSVRYNRERGI